MSSPIITPAALCRKIARENEKAMKAAEKSYILAIKAAEKATKLAMKEALKEAKLQAKIQSKKPKPVLCPH